MPERTTHRHVHPPVDLPSSILVAGVILLIILFWGKPDIADAIIYRLTHGADLMAAEMGPGKGNAP